MEFGSEGDGGLFRFPSLLSSGRASCKSEPEVPKHELAEPTYVFVASEVRSGSTYVAELISYSLHASGGGEVWDLTKEQFRHLDDRSLPEDVTATLSALSLSPEQFRSSKVMCSALSVLVRCARSDAGLRDTVFGPRAKWIVVRRRNRIRQAVSLAVARKTNRYHVYCAEEGESHVDVSLGEIEDALRAVIMSDCYLESFLALPHVATQVFYEDVMADPAGSTRRALNDLGLLTDRARFTFRDAKLVPDRRLQKLALEESFRHLLLENNHTTF